VQRLVLLLVVMLHRTRRHDIWECQATGSATSAFLRLLLLLLLLPLPLPLPLPLLPLPLPLPVRRLQSEEASIARAVMAFGMPSGATMDAADDRASPTRRHDTECQAKRRWTMDGADGRCCCRPWSHRRDVIALKTPRDATMDAASADSGLTGGTS